MSTNEYDRITFMNTHCEYTPTLIELKCNSNGSYGIHYASRDMDTIMLLNGLLN
jgi:hypothetical protein